MEKLTAEQINALCNIGKRTKSADEIALETQLKALREKNKGTSAPREQIIESITQGRDHTETINALQDELKQAHELHQLARIEMKTALDMKKRVKGAISALTDRIRTELPSYQKTSYEPENGDFTILPKGCNVSFTFNPLKLGVKGWKSAVYEYLTAQGFGAKGSADDRRADSIVSRLKFKIAEKTGISQLSADDELI